MNCASDPAATLNFWGSVVTKPSTAACGSSLTPALLRKVTDEASAGRERARHSPQASGADPVALAEEVGGDGAALRHLARVGPGQGGAHVRVQGQRVRSPRAKIAAIGTANRAFPACAHVRGKVGAVKRHVTAPIGRPQHAREVIAARYYDIPADAIHSAAAKQRELLL